jgi:hypothetical protein
MLLDFAKCEASMERYAQHRRSETTPSDILAIVLRIKEVAEGNFGKSLISLLSAIIHRSLI